MVYMTISTPILGMICHLCHLATINIHTKFEVFISTQIVCDSHTFRVTVAQAWNSLPTNVTASTSTVFQETT